MIDGTLRRSALYHLHRRSGAEFVEHQGWHVAASFGSPDKEAEQVRRSCGIGDLSYRAKFGTRKDPGESGWRLGRNHYFVGGEPPLTPPESSVDVTSVYANLLLAGPRSGSVLGKLSSLNVSERAFVDGSCGQTSIAHVHAIVVRENIGTLPAFHILVGRDYAESVWEAIEHAGQEFGITGFGLRALELLKNGGREAVD